MKVAGLSLFLLRSAYAISCWRTSCSDGSSPPCWEPKNVRQTLTDCAQADIYAKGKGVTGGGAAFNACNRQRIRGDKSLVPGGDVYIYSCAGTDSRDLERFFCNRCNTVNGKPTTCSRVSVADDWWFGGYLTSLGGGLITKRFTCCNTDGCNDPAASATPPPKDCLGLRGGTASNDTCGVCKGDNSTCTDACGVVNGDNSSCTGCSGRPNSGLVLDECQECGGNGSSCGRSGLQYLQHEDFQLRKSAGGSTCHSVSSRLDSAASATAGWRAKGFAIGAKPALRALAKQPALGNCIRADFAGWPSAAQRQAYAGTLAGANHAGWRSSCIECHGSCTDAKWTGLGGGGCANYTRTPAFCNAAGAFVRNARGVRAVDACCACGGGLQTSKSATQYWYTGSGCESYSMLTRTDYAFGECKADARRAVYYEAKCDSVTARKCPQMAGGVQIRAFDDRSCGGSPKQYEVALPAKDVGKCITSLAQHPHGYGVEMFQSYSDTRSFNVCCDGSQVVLYRFRDANCSLPDNTTESTLGRVYKLGGCNVNVEAKLRYSAACDGVAKSRACRGLNDYVIDNGGNTVVIEPPLPPPPPPPVPVPWALYGFYSATLLLIGYICFRSKDKLLKMRAQKKQLEVYKQGIKTRRASLSQPGFETGWSGAANKLHSASVYVKSPRADDGESSAEKDAYAHLKEIAGQVLQEQADHQSTSTYRLLHDAMSGAIASENAGDDGMALDLLQKAFAGVIANVQSGVSYEEVSASRPRRTSVSGKKGKRRGSIGDEDVELRREKRELRKEMQERERDGGGGDDENKDPWQRLTADRPRRMSKTEVKAQKNRPRRGSASGVPQSRPRRSSRRGSLEGKPGQNRARRVSAGSIPSQDRVRRGSVGKANPRLKNGERRGSLTGSERKERRGSVGEQRRGSITGERQRRGSNTSSTGSARGGSASGKRGSSASKSRRGSSSGRGSNASLAVMKQKPTGLSTIMSVDIRKSVDLFDSKVASSSFKQHPFGVVEDDEDKYDEMSAAQLMVANAQARHSKSDRGFQIDGGSSFQRRDRKAAGGSSDARGGSGDARGGSGDGRLGESTSLLGDLGAISVKGHRSNDPNRKRRVSMEQFKSNIDKDDMDPSRW